MQINIPQASYRAARTGCDIVKNFFAELDSTMELAVGAHLQKKAKTTELISAPGQPLWQLGQTAQDGKPYVDLDNSTYILSFVGLTEAVHFLIGQELHESKEAQRFGLKVLAHMQAKAKKLSAKHNLHITISESVADGVPNRMAQSDMVYFTEESKGTVKEIGDAVYYTNSAHLSAAAELSLFDRIVEQAKYHGMIETDAVTPCYFGDGRAQTDSVADLVTEAFYRTQSTQVCISTEFSSFKSIVIDRFNKEKTPFKSNRYHALIELHSNQAKTVKTDVAKPHLVSAKIEG